MKHAADQLKASGATVVTVGAGENVDMAILTEMATSANMAYPSVGEVDREAVMMLEPPETCEFASPVSRRRKRDVSYNPVHRSKRTAATEERCKLYGFSM